MKHFPTYIADFGTDCAFCEGLPPKKLGPRHMGVRFGDNELPIEHFTVDGIVVPADRVYEAMVGPKGWLIKYGERDGKLFACSETHSHAYAFRLEGNVMSHWYPEGVKVPARKPLEFDGTPEDF